MQLYILAPEVALVEVAKHLHVDNGLLVCLRTS